MPISWQKNSNKSPNHAETHTQIMSITYPNHAKRTPNHAQTIPTLLISTHANKIYKRLTSSVRTIPKPFKTHPLIIKSFKRMSKSSPNDGRTIILPRWLALQPLFVTVQSPSNFLLSTTICRYSNNMYHFSTTSHYSITFCHKSTTTRPYSINVQSLFSHRNPTNSNLYLTFHD